jgi:UDP-glucuronate 4-epimerase
MRVLVTGAAGFIGFHTSRKLLERGDEVIGVDNLNPYYDVSLKEARRDLLQQFERFRFHLLDLKEGEAVAELFADYRPEGVVHLAAQAGVRYSLQNPQVYIDSNVTGTLNILEGCRHHPVRHLVFASTSSVYGANTRMPFSVQDNADHPISLYAATKRADELMAHVYSHLFRIPTTGLRFFTVYGPWGRPDMAMFIFTRAILEDRPIELFNQGDLRRDFTYVDDIAEGVVRALDRPAEPDPHWSGDSPEPSSSSAPYRLYNIGNNRPIALPYLIETLERCLGKKAHITLMPMQPGDVPETYADIDALIRDIGFQPATPIETGVARFVAWYRDYYGV